MSRLGQRVEDCRGRIAHLHRPDYEYYNLIPRQSLSDCICLLMGMRPDARDLALKNSPYSEVLAVASAHIDSGMLPSYKSGTTCVVAWGACNAAEFVSWAQSIGIESPAEWQPIAAGSLTENTERTKGYQHINSAQSSDTAEPKPVAEEDAWEFKSGCSDIDKTRFGCVLKAAISMMDGPGGYVPRSKKECVLDATHQGNRNDYPSCSISPLTRINYDTVERSVRKAGDVFTHPKFLEAKKRFYQSRN